MNILFVSLGCDKNLVDSEYMLGLLKEANYNIVDDESIADAIVVNTCCFIHDAKEESIETILTMAKLKETGRLKALIITGCLAQRYSEDIRKEIPEVDAIVGASCYDEIVEAVNQAIEGHSIDILKDINYLPHNKVKRVLTSTGGFYAYLKIAEGCDKHCTYCVIPKIRGNYRSIPMEELIADAKQLASEGIKELIVIAQETTLYGTDIYGKKMLPKLLEELSLIEDIEWIRLLYCYPEEITDELINTMANLPKVKHYIDIPIQHSEDSVLMRMGRKTNKAHIIDIIAKLRKAMPDISIRTTLITGFPGETKENHENLMSFIDDMEFDRLGVFTYSKEEDTPAASYDNQVDEATALEWKNEIMELQQEISEDNNEKMIGKIIEVLVEGFLYNDNIYVGRSYKDAPGIDGYVFFNSKTELLSGDIVKVKIKDYNEYDLIGDIEDEFTK